MVLCQPSPNLSDEQDLRRYIRLLRDQWRLAAGIVVVCVVVAVAVALAQPSRYRATASLLFLPAQAPSLNETALDPARVIATLSGLAGTQVVLANASAASHIPVKTLRSSVHSTASINGDLIDVAGTAPSGAKAAARANAIANALARVRQIEAQDVVRSNIAQFQQQLNSLGKPKASTQTTRTTVQGQLLAAQSELASTKGDVNVVQPATVPTAAASPKPSLNAAIGFLVGLLAAVLVLLARDRIDRRPRTGVELEKLWQLPVVGAIREVGMNGRVGAATVDGFRMLRSNLLLHADGDLPRVLLVTSAVEGEGKSAVAANLARALAEHGRRVVAVSADLHTSALQQHMAIESSTSIAEVLEDDVYPTDVVTRVPLGETSGGSLDMLASDGGSNGSSTSLVSRKMEDLLDDLRDEYEIVVIDAPTILPASETVLLARNPGMQMLIVASIGGAQRRDIERARERLALAKVEAIGLVVCGADSE
jgi:succinoglycan biosynthesis transport protein ExoP